MPHFVAPNSHGGLSPLYKEGVKRRSLWFRSSAKTERHPGVTVMGWGPLGVTWAASAASVWQEEVESLLSHSFQDGCLLAWRFLQSPGIGRAVFKASLCLGSQRWVYCDTYCSLVCVRVRVCVCMCVRARVYTSSLDDLPNDLEQEDVGDPPACSPASPRSRLHWPAPCLRAMRWSQPLPRVLLASSLPSAFWIISVAGLIFLFFFFYSLFGDVLIYFLFKFCVSLSFSWLVPCLSTLLRWLSSLLIPCCL